jgi:Ca2+-binding EF-hand superfamily protein
MCGRDRLLVPPVALNDVAQAAKDAASSLSKLEALAHSHEKRFSSAFDEVDTTGTGFIEGHDLPKLHRALQNQLGRQFSGDTFMNIVSDLNAESTGRIDRGEFIQYFVFKELDLPDCYGAIFDAVDVECTGKLKMKELEDFQWYKHPKVFQLLGISDFSAFVSRQIAPKVNGIDAHPAITEITADQFTELMTRCRKEPLTASNGDAKESGGSKPVTVAEPLWRHAARIESDWRGELGWIGHRAPPSKKGKRKVVVVGVESDWRGDHYNEACSEFAAGYCSRGQWCWQSHSNDNDLGVPASSSAVDSSENQFLTLAADLGFNFGRLSSGVRAELLSVPEEHSERVLRSVAIGGDLAFVEDKNFFIVHEVRRLKAFRPQRLQERRKVEDEKQLSSETEGVIEDENQSSEKLLMQGSVNDSLSNLTESPQKRRRVEDQKQFISSENSHPQGSVDDSLGNLSVIGA